MTRPLTDTDPWPDRLTSKAHDLVAERLLEHLVGLAEFALPCPTAEVLATTLRCNKSSVAGLFHKLVKRRQVLVDTERRPAGRGRTNYFRRVTIVATGKRTAPAVPPRAAALDEDTLRLERAVAFLRSRGPTVYVEGAVVHVDRRMMPAAEAIRLALRKGFEACRDAAPPAPTPYAAHYGSRA